jgi:hypothetical protein
VRVGDRHRVVGLAHHRREALDLLRGAPRLGDVVEQPDAADHAAVVRAERRVRDVHPPHVGRAVRPSAPHLDAPPALRHELAGEGGRVRLADGRRGEVREALGGRGADHLVGGHAVELRHRRVPHGVAPARVEGDDAVARSGDDRRGQLLRLAQRLGLPFELVVLLEQRRVGRLELLGLATELLPLTEERLVLPLELLGLRGDAGVPVLRLTEGAGDGRDGRPHARRPQPDQGEQREPQHAPARGAQLAGAHRIVRRHGATHDVPQHHRVRRCEQGEQQEAEGRPAGEQAGVGRGHDVRWTDGPGAGRGPVPSSIGRGRRHLDGGRGVGVTDGPARGGPRDRPEPLRAEAAAGPRRCRHGRSLA